MRAWRTNIAERDLLPVRDRILGEVAKAGPTGFEWHPDSQAHRTVLFDEMPDSAALRAEIEKAGRQLGTLGGGNHFIELSVDAQGVVWAMIHSGSRNVGKQMAEYYDGVARAENRSSRSSVTAEWELAHLDIAHGAGAEYLTVMNWCLAFARENRRLMAEAVQGVLDRHFPSVTPDEAIDIHHNYAAVETHGGELVVVHRKGAVRAEGPVIVPGSMGTRSYIGRGLDSERSFGSCSHGAGRAMGRRQAVRTLPRDEVMAELEARGVRLVKDSLRDVAEEAPQAYKDIDEVMAHQRDLVTAEVQLIPVGVLKG